jgi:hypothetical protein
MPNVPSCPYCRKNAPIVYRGMMAYCTACGQPRLPFAASAVNLAGQPSKVGGEVARILGWVVLAVGLLVALMFGALLQAIFPAGVAGFVIGGVIAFAAILLGTVLVRGGKTLHTSGDEKERATRTQAVFALAANRGGVLSALDVAQALSLTLPVADALLTKLAKEDSDRVKLEVDDNGAITFVFPHALPLAPNVTSPPRARVAAPDADREVVEAEMTGEDAAQSPLGSRRRTP